MAFDNPFSRLELPPAHGCKIQNQADFVIYAKDSCRTGIEAVEWYAALLTPDQRRDIVAMADAQIAKRHGELQERKQAMELAASALDDATMRFEAFRKFNADPNNEPNPKEASRKIGAFNREHVMPARQALEEAKRWHKICSSNLQGYEADLKRWVDVVKSHGV
jgi:hypothetical protein